jgi:hypothetical protein
MKAKPNTYTPEQLNWMGDHRAILQISAFTAEFNRRFGLNQSKIALCGICKRNKWAASTTGKFHAGMIPHNKGKAGTGYCKPNSGSFGVPGNTNAPMTTRPIGSERIDKDGYIRVKVADNKWPHKHLLIWIAANGPIPKKHMVKFIDGDKTNIALENLELMHKKINIRLNKNHFSQEPEALKPVIKAFHIFNQAIIDKQQEASHG